jgi:hypothetical protein
MAAAPRSLVDKTRPNRAMTTSMRRLLLLTALSTTACGYAVRSTQYVQTIPPEGAEGQERCRIPVYRSLRPAVAFREIGIIEAYGGGVVTTSDRSIFDRSVEELRKKGCELGADALIDVEVTAQYGGAIGTAVVFEAEPSP